MAPIDTEISMFGAEQRFETICPTPEGVASLENLMGKNVQYRKDFVFSNIDFSKIGE